MIATLSISLEQDRIPSIYPSVLVWQVARLWQGRQLPSRSRVQSLLMAVRSPALSVSIALTMCLAGWSQQYSITTIAGNGSQGFSGDSGSAVGSQLNFPAAIAIDGSGKIYIADSANNRIRMISNGVITTVAGNGTAGYTGDNGPATSAELSDPLGVALDSSGNLYIADSGNNVVRKVSGSTITTFAGNNTAGYMGDGGAANSAELSDPTAVAVDSAGNVYIADASNNVIRKVSGGNINTLASGLTHPDGLALDAAGNVYIADTGGRRIVEYSGGTYTTLAGTGRLGFTGDDGPGPSAELGDPMGIAVDASGNVYIADTFNNRIRKLSSSGIITTIAGTGALYYSGDGGAAVRASLYFPHAINLDGAGNVYVADTFNGVVRLLQPNYPAIIANGVVNAASFAAKISPGALATVFGTNFAAVTTTGKTPLPASLGGVGVNINGRPARILYVSGSQVNFQVPWETEIGAGTVTVLVNGGPSASINVPVVAAGPGLFTTSSGHALVQNSNFTLNSPENPAEPGSTIIAYLTGSGPVSPPVADGMATPLDALVTASSPVTASIGSRNAQVTFAGLAPGFVGLMQVNITVPTGIAAGEQVLTISIQDETSNTGTISIAPSP